MRPRPRSRPRVRLRAALTASAALSRAARVVESSLRFVLGRRRVVHHDLGGGNAATAVSHRAGDGRVRKARIFHQRLHLSDDCQRLGSR